MAQQLSNDFDPTRSIVEFERRACMRRAHMTPTAGATVFDLRTALINGQSLAGSGALVFEGELVSPDRTH